MAPSSREGCFQGHVFGLTGELRRRDLEATLKSNGAQISAIIHRRVSFVVCTPDAVKYNTQKVRKACKHGIPLVSEEFVNACANARSVVDHTSFLLSGPARGPDTPKGDNEVDDSSTRRDVGVERHTETSGAADAQEAVGSCTSVNGRKKRSRTLSRSSLDANEAREPVADDTALSGSPIRPEVMGGTESAEHLEYHQENKTRMHGGRKQHREGGKAESGDVRPNSAEPPKKVKSNRGGVLSVIVGCGARGGQDEDKAAGSGVVGGVMHVATCGDDAKNKSKKKNKKRRKEKPYGE